ncbi:TetR/AcrR family transcriptional regulator [Georgenia sp. EYE_87]|uniref:TetR/AcrR family transcriptional regulator n=1 Tax=Georgenia sp. EYE_87 TaxID=2853448 RepID=UPI0020031FA4|nr:TetR/AcrR family transcriptional regulator [Georgenia sp. EYE_87]MCK6211295.1 TetR/AcrR family transcriptional regulator [Georgenia sp. EYE_87]
MPKIIGGSLAEHRERTRTALFAALSELMTERGFDAISLADIAGRAGVGRTAVYNHFPDKESLLLAFIEHETSSYVRSLEASLGEVAEPVEQLRVYVRQQLALAPAYHFAPGPDLREVVSHEAARDLRAHVSQVESLLRNILTRAIEAGAIPAQDLDAVVPLVHACLSGRRGPQEEPGRSAFVAATEEFVLRAVGAAVTSPAAFRAAEVEAEAEVA